jgi:serine/threonine protein kinase
MGLAASPQPNLTLQPPSSGVGSVAAFAREITESPDTTIEAFLGRRPDTDPSALAGLVAIELRQRWARGNPCPVEQYLERFPQLHGQREQLLDVLYADYCERRKHGQPGTPEEYCERFPEYRESLLRVFSTHSLLRDAVQSLGWDTPTDPLPEAGGRFLDFRLVRELGRGGFARVFLARQGLLANRWVVVKIAGRSNVESQTLAKLDHAHIVPIHSVHPDPKTKLQAVCMPYHGAVSLRDVLAQWHPVASTPPRRDGHGTTQAVSTPPGGTVPRQAAAIFGMLDQLIPAELRAVASHPVAPTLPRRGSYVRACCWILHKLADALAHAHERGICHRDLKPSNVLLTHAGQPLLVDFNLAGDQAECDDVQAAFGGTLPYMPPEQLQVFVEPDALDQVGPHSDVYSLAATGYELLTGRQAFPISAAADSTSVVAGQIEIRGGVVPSARAANRCVPAEIDALLARCLHPDPRQRCTMVELADDLKRYLDDIPLRHTGPVSRWTRATKYVRRHARRAAALGVGALACAVAGLAVHHFWPRQYRYPAEAYLEGVKLCQAGQFAEGLTALDTAQDMGRNDYLLFYWKGKALAALDRDRAGLDAFTHSIELNGRYTYSYLGRGLTYATTRFVDCRDPLRAVADAEMACGIEPNNPAVLYEAARICTAAWNVTANRDQFDRAAELLATSFRLGLRGDDLLRFDSQDKHRLLAPLRDHPMTQQYWSGTPSPARTAGAASN